MAGPPAEELTRDANRERRLGDAAKLIPLLGAALMMVPMLWVLGSKTSSALVYLFLVWISLIVLAALLARSLSALGNSKSERQSDQESRS